MNTKTKIEAKVRITLFLLIWAIICLTTFSERSSLLRGRFRTDVTPKSFLEYFAINK